MALADRVSDAVVGDTIYLRGSRGILVNVETRSLVSKLGYVRWPPEGNTIAYPFGILKYYRCCRNCQQPIEAHNPFDDKCLFGPGVWD